MLQFIFIRAVTVPAFSRADDIEREDVLGMVFSLRIEDALIQLRRAYPISSPSMADFNMSESTDYPEENDGGYQSIHRTYIDPIARAHALSLRLSAVIANHFTAHG